MPLGLDQPYWIDDVNFDIEFHVREISLPTRARTRNSPSRSAGCTHARPLDRRRPLWEMYLISGLAGGRVAAYAKMHHAAIDGVSGNELMSVLLDLTPEGDKRPPVTDFKPELAPSATTLLARTAASMVTRPLSAARIATGLGRSLPLVGSYLTQYVGAILGGGHGDGEVISTAPGLPPGRRSTTRSPNTGGSPCAASTLMT